MRLTRDYKVEVLVGKPKVAYKEAITKAAEARGTAQEAVRWSRSVW